MGKEPFVPVVGPCAAEDPVVGAKGTFYPPFPILALASDGSDVFMTGGGGGSTSVKEVPNMIHVHRYCMASQKLSTIAAYNTGANLVVHLSYSHVANLWLASARQGCKIMSLDGNTLSELCFFESESEGKEPEQNFAFYSPNASLIVTGGTDGLVKVWNAGARGTEPTLQRTCGSKTKEIVHAAFSPDGQHLAAADGTGTCRLWELSKQGAEDGTVLTYMSKAVKGKALIKLVCFASHRTEPTLMLAANGTQRKMAWGVVGFFNLTGDMLSEVVVEQGPLKSISVAMDEQHCVVGTMSGKKVILKLPELKCRQRTKELHSLPSQCVAWSGAMAISVSGDRDVHMLRVNIGGSSGFGVRFVMMFLLITVLILYQLYRIGSVGAMVGQGKIDL